MIGTQTQSQPVHFIRQVGDSNASINVWRLYETKIFFY